MTLRPLPPVYLESTLTGFSDLFVSLLLLFFFSASNLCFVFLSTQEKDKERDPHGWLFCTSRSGHDPDKLMPTQIIAGKALECMGRLVHSYRKQWNIVQFCDCPEALEGNKAIEAANVETNGSVNSGSNGICKVGLVTLAFSDSIELFSINDLHAVYFVLLFFFCAYFVVFLPAFLGNLMTSQNLNASSSKTDKMSNDGISNGDADGKGADSDSVKPVNGTPTQPAGDSKNGGNQTGSMLLNVLADVALSKEKKTGKSKNGYGATVKGEAGDGTTVNGSDGESDLPSDEEEGGEHFSTLRELLIRPAPKTNSGKNAEQNAAPVAKRQRMETLEDVISCVIERAVDREASPEASNSAATTAAAGSTSNSSAPVTAPSKETNGEQDEVTVNVELLHFKRRVDAFKTGATGRGFLAPRIMVYTESSKAYPDIPHSWLCNGKLLRLHDPSNPNNYKIFQVGFASFKGKNRNLKIGVIKCKWEKTCYLMKPT